MGGRKAACRRVRHAHVPWNHAATDWTQCCHGVIRGSGCASAAMVERVWRSDRRLRAVTERVWGTCSNPSAMAVAFGLRKGCSARGKTGRVASVCLVNVKLVPAHGDPGVAAVVDVGNAEAKAIVVGIQNGL